MKRVKINLDHQVEKLKLKQFEVCKPFIYSIIRDKIEKYECDFIYYDAFVKELIDRAPGCKTFLRAKDFHKILKNYLIVELGCVIE